jgi:hypothetical protein
MANPLRPTGNCFSIGLIEGTLRLQASGPRLILPGLESFRLLNWCISVFVQSRSDRVKVAVGFNQVSTHGAVGKMPGVAERRLKIDCTTEGGFRRRCATRLRFPSLRGLKPTATVMTSLCEAEPALRWHPISETRPLSTNRLFSNHRGLGRIHTQKLTQGAILNGSRSRLFSRRAVRFVISISRSAIEKLD